MRRAGALIIVLSALAAACGTGASGLGSARVRAPVLAQAPGVPEPTAPEPDRFAGGVYRIGPGLRDRLTGRNWRPGCPIAIEDLRLVRVRYWNFHGNVRSGPVIVNERVATDILGVFRRLFQARFPIQRLDLPPRYRPPRPIDYENTRNLSSAFNCRPATGNTGSLSHHSYGWAIDINPMQNPYVGADGSVLRKAAEPYVDRTRRRRGMVHAGGVVVRAFARIDWEWGGDWRTLKDYMHFSLTGR